MGGQVMPVIEMLDASFVEILLLSLSLSSD
jgi:hypothetical protein